jgi:hypothetical protein
MDSHRAGEENEAMDSTETAQAGRSDRRGTERREKDLPYAGDERRQSERRSGHDRRAAARG